MGLSWYPTVHPADVYTLQHQRLQALFVNHEREAEAELTQAGTVRRWRTGPGPQNLAWRDPPGQLQVAEEADFSMSEAPGGNLATCMCNCRLRCMLCPANLTDAPGD